ncbi:hypothetical protein SNE40_016576 [Patella caerulea]|uniref:Uncharacterized protein n=2 Tax=Patella caerulea TaxID=87958 RepID=A0AAN8PNS5_PATCE
MPSLDLFCGGSSIWNTTLLLENTFPEFSDCFQTLVLDLIPCVFLWLTLPVFIAYLRTIPKPSPIPLSKLSTTKTVLCILLSVLTLTHLVVRLHNDVTSNSFIVSVSVRCLTFLLLAILCQVSRVYGLPSPCLPYIFWILMVVTNLVPFYTLIIKQVFHDQLFQFVLFYIYFAIIAIQLVMFSFSEVTPPKYFKKQEFCPFQYASFPSKIFFHWTNSLVFTGYKKVITEEDVFDVPDKYKSEQVSPTFLTAWDRKLSKERYKISKENIKEVYGNNIYDGKTEVKNEGGDIPLLQPGERPHTTISRPTIALFKVLVKTYWTILARGNLLRLCSELMNFVNPFLLRTMISYIEHRDKESKWKGFVLVAGFSAVSFTQSAIFNQTFFHMQNLAMNMKTSLVAAVYRKSLTMNNNCRKQFTVGAIVNMMSVDCQKVTDVVVLLYMVWSAPLMVGLSLNFLYHTIGISFIAGLCVIIAITPINLIISTIVKRIHTQLLSVQDSRLKIINEVLNGMKVLKLYAWETSFEKKILDIRQKELNILKKEAILNASSAFCMISAPALVALASFTMYIMMSENKQLDAQTAFVALNLFNILRNPMHQLPMCLSSLIQAQVSLVRLGKYLSGGDLAADNVSHFTKPGNVIEIHDGTFSWDESLPPTLKSINMEIKEGELIAVVGPVGAGKSSLLSALLGEMDKLKGAVNIKGTVAYVPQQAWIQNLSLKDNILFGQDATDNYTQVLKDCALETDLAVLPGGEATEIGERGINLSGGQKQRVSLARAVCSDRDIYLMDDPLSAVDAHVGKHIFRNVIGSQGSLKKKTRVLVTHGIHWLPMVDRIIVMDKGTITDIGHYGDLLGNGGSFAQFLEIYMSHENEKEESLSGGDSSSRLNIERLDSIIADVASLSEDGDSLFRSHSIGNLDDPEVLSQDGEDGNVIDVITNLIEDEWIEKGKISFSVLRRYVSHMGFLVTGLIMMMFLLYQVAAVSSNIWLSVWIEDTSNQDITQDGLTNTTKYGLTNITQYSLTNITQYGLTNMTQDELTNKDEVNVPLSPVTYYLGIYAFLSLAQAVLVLMYMVTLYTSMVRAAKVMFSCLLNNILHQPMSFFDTTPSGRIMNRFTRDVNILDTGLNYFTRQFLNTLFVIISIVVVISYSAPVFIAAVIPIFTIYYFIQKFYVPTSRQLRRNESIARSPIYSHFTETITGASSIRAYSDVERFRADAQKRMNKNNVFHFAAISISRWCRMRLEILGNITVSIASLLAVLMPHMTGSEVGLSIIYAIQVTQSLNIFVQVSTQLEVNIVSVERILEYTDIPQEADWFIEESKPPDEWPNSGEIQLDNLQTRYRADLPLVLKGISCSVRGGEKVGIVGRTGAGKSSLSMVLFRIIESTGGVIRVDGIDIAALGLHDLRSNITILPQDPVLFTGALRINLDPFNEFSDEDLWTALEHAHLKEFISTLPSGLDYECDEGGGNLSIGQRQLLCLARSLLRKTKVLILDEATAAVDLETDDLIQKTIRSEFKDCTVLSIAHRLNTIMDYDRVMVLDDGEIVEFDSPTNLLQDKLSAFYGMAKDANITQ